MYVMRSAETTAPREEKIYGIPKKTLLCCAMTDWMWLWADEGAEELNSFIYRMRRGFPTWLAPDPPRHTHQSSHPHLNQWVGPLPCSWSFQCLRHTYRLSGSSSSSHFADNNKPRNVGLLGVGWIAWDEFWNQHEQCNSQGWLGFFLWKSFRMRHVAFILGSSSLGFLPFRKKRVELIDTQSSYYYYYYSSLFCRTLFGGHSSYCNLIASYYFHII